MPLRVVTDSSCDLPQQLARDLGVVVVPCNIHFGQEIFRDGVDMQPNAFYQRLSQGAAPTTSQPSVGAFLETYRGLAGQATEVLSLHISSKLSGTCQAALQARSELKGEPRIEVVDSLQVSLGLGLLVREAARLAREGAALDEVLGRLAPELPRVLSYCTVDTLEYLVHGGRARKIQGFFGALLDIKPIIMVKGGETHPVDRVRSRRRALQRLSEIAAAVPGLRALGVMHAACPEDAEALADACSAFFPRDQIIISEFTPVLGAHLGPRAMGLALWAGATPAP